MKRTRNACTSPLRCAGRWAAVSRAEQQTAAEAAAAHLNVMFCVASCRLAARLPALGLDVTSMVYRTFIGWLYHLIRAMTLTLRSVTGGRVPCLSRFLSVRCSCPALPCPVAPFPRVACGPAPARSSDLLEPDCLPRPEDGVRSERAPTEEPPHLTHHRSTGLLLHNPASNALVTFETSLSGPYDHHNSTPY